MLDQNLDNLHKYKTDVVSTGAKLFQIDSNDPEMFVIVISSILRTKFIEMEILDASEVYRVLNQVLLIQLGMRTPDL